MEYTKFGLKVKTEVARQKKSLTWLAKEMKVSNTYITHCLCGLGSEERIAQIKKLLNMK